MTELQVITEEEAVKNNDEEKTDAIPGINKERPLFMPNKNGFMTFPVPNPDEVIIGTTRAIPAEKDDHPGDNKGPSSCDNLDFGSCDKTSISFDSKEISHSDIKEPSSFDNIKSRSCDREKLQRHQSHEDHSKHMKSCNDKSTQGPKELTKKKSRRRKSKREKYLEDRQVDQDQISMLRKANISEEQQVDILGDVQESPWKFTAKHSTQTALLRETWSSHARDKTCRRKMNEKYGHHNRSNTSNTILWSSADILQDVVSRFLPTCDSSTAEISCWRTYLHLLLVNCFNLLLIMAIPVIATRKQTKYFYFCVALLMPCVYCCTSTQSIQVVTAAGDNLTVCLQVPSGLDYRVQVDNDTIGSFNMWERYNTHHNVIVGENYTMKYAINLEQFNCCVSLFKVSFGEKAISIIATGNVSICIKRTLRVQGKSPDENDHTGGANYMYVLYVLLPIGAVVIICVTIRFRKKLREYFCNRSNSLGEDASNNKDNEEKEACL